MEPILYAGLRNPARDRESYEAILHHPVSEVAQERKCSPSTIRAAARRISEMQLFTLRLTGGKEIAVGTIAARSFRRAALGAYRHFGGTFKNLELPTWALTDGTSRISIAELRELDSGAARWTMNEEGTWHNQAAPTDSISSSRQNAISAFSWISTQRNRTVNVVRVLGLPLIATLTLPNFAHAMPLGGFPHHPARNTRCHPWQHACAGRLGALIHRLHRVASVTT